MTAGQLYKILKDNFSSGTLYEGDEVVVYSDGENIEIISAECDTQTSDFIINI